MSNFITNQGSSNLKERLVELIGVSQELKFLVGFFYYSGIRELYEGLKDNNKVKLEVLVGLNVDNLLFNIVEHGEDDNAFSDEEKINHFFKSVKNSINSKNFDTKEFYEQIPYFIKMIKEDRLIIRKTFKPNHSKIYIFKLQNSQIGKKELFITGSSNLTKSGLSTQEEFNVEIGDYGFKNTEEYFDEQWKNAVKITEIDEFKQKLITIIEDETQIKKVTPFEAYILLLKTYLDGYEQDDLAQSTIDLLEERGYKPYTYQLDAVKQAKSILAKHNGVIIADVVGLGKSVIASMLAKEIGKRGLIICPPGLIGDKNKKSGWEMYKEDFKLHNWEIRSCGEREKLLELVDNCKDIEVVIIDEAHRYRNEDTKDYEILKNVCRNKQVILLTATPLNNTPGDILSLLELFIVPKKSTITLENDIKAKFRTFKGTFDRLAYIIKNHKSLDEKKRTDAISKNQALFGTNEVNIKQVKERAKYLSNQIRDVIEPVTIRRNRLDLLNDPEYKKEVKELSKIKDPMEWYFDLTPEQSNFYNEILESYFANPDEGGRFKGAIYRPFEYETGKTSSSNLGLKENFAFIQQRNLHDFMRRLLVKRFESSFGAFKQSLINFRKVTETVLKFIENSNGKYILDRKLLEQIYLDDIDDIENSLMEYEKKLEQGVINKKEKIYKINDFKYKDRFLNDIKSDKKMFTEILEKLNTLDLVNNDPKAERLIQKIKEEIKNKPAQGEPIRKIIIFTEYQDTAKYLRALLEKEFAETVLTSTGTLTSKKIQEINENFDAMYKEQKNEFQILLATDKLSEGFNLNRAGMVINYDIPWNPVRVIQRVGRINRISKKVFNELYIVNFFPTEKGATINKSREIAQHKMFLIHNTLGEDAKIFEVDEEPSKAKLFTRIQQNPEELEEESFATKIRRELHDIKNKYANIYDNIQNLPPRVKVAKKYKDNSLLVFIRKGRMYINEGRIEDDGKHIIQSVIFENAYPKIKCEKNEPIKKLSQNFWECYEKTKNYQEKGAVAISDMSLETKAKNTLSTLISKKEKNYFEQLPFLRILRKDIDEYGTLSDYTLRRIGNLIEMDIKEQIVEIDNIKKELGGANYLEKEKQRINTMQQEVIIAIENQ
jgi:ERCC4-related helicase